MSKNLTLGYAGEYGARAMTIDLYEEAELWPDATPKLLLCRPGEDAPYVFEGTTYENSCLTFTPRKVDTAIAGTGYAQVYFYGADGTLLGKSGLMTTLILRAMSGDVTQEPSAEQKSYYDNLMEQVALAVAAGQTAPGYAQSAAESAAAAAAAQEAAEAAASSVTITTDEINAAGNAALSAIEQKRASALADIPDDYTALYGDVSSLKDQKANVIIDTSARAASHELHAQDGTLAVTLYGKTTETGTGDKSPDNPYVISGVDVARVHAGGKNLFDISKVYAGLLSDGNIRIEGTTYNIDFYSSLSGWSTPVSDNVRNNLIFLNAGNYTITFDIAFDDTSITGKRLDICEVNADNTIREHHAVNSGGVFTVNESGPVTIRKETGGAATISNIMLSAGSTATAYEPYNANVITPALLPSGSPLMGNGTVDDTVENDVLSGCDKKIVLNSSKGWALRNESSLSKVSFSSSTIMPDYFVDTIGFTAYADKCEVPKSRGVVPASGLEGLSVYYNGASQTDKILYLSITGVTTLADLDTYLAANPLTVFYRSTDYTPEKDLRVCKTVRRLKTATLDKNSAGGLGTTSDGKPRLSYPKFKDWTAYNNYLSALDIGFCASEIAVIARTADGGTLVTNFNQTSFGIIFPEGTTHDQAKEAIDGTKFVYQLATPEVYMTDPLALRKPTGIMPVTVTGSGETAVEYPHETKHYIDSQIAAAVALALGN